MLAQPQFQFLPRALKAQEMAGNVQLQGELQKLNQLRELLQSGNSAVESRLLSSSQEFFALMKQIDGSDELSKVSTFDRLRKTQTALNEEAAQIVLDRFGVKGVSLDNLEQVYNPLVSGFGTMQAARAHLIKKGMTAELADKLAQRYISKLEQEGSQVYSLMDFFNGKASADAINALLKNPLTQVHFSYQTWADYKQGVADKNV